MKMIQVTEVIYSSSTQSLQDECDHLINLEYITSVTVSPERRAATRVEFVGNQGYHTRSILTRLTLDEWKVLLGQ